MREMALCLGGKFTEGAESCEVRAPWDGRVVALVARASAEQLAQAMDGAESAAPSVARLSAASRAEILIRAREMIGAQADALAQAIVEEAGKPLLLARAEVQRAQDTFLAAAEIARHPEVATQDLDGYGSGSGRLALVRRVPVGPVLAITPFNFPLNLVAHKLAPAIAAGCPIVIKPASQTPSAALMLARIVIRAGLPEEAISVVPCLGADAAPLVDDPRVRLLTFTGSAEVGWQLKQRAWRGRVALELGGNAAVIVEPDGGDARSIARSIAGAAFAYAGQSCISVQRILVRRGIHDALRDALVEATAAVRAGNPAQDGVLCGPLIDRANAERVEDWIGEALGAGGRLLCGGEREGSLVQPTLLEEVPPREKVVAGEVFGPVAVLAAYDDFEQALELVNDSRYGLQAGVFTRDMEKIRRAWDVLEVGGVIQGDVPTWRSDPMPYGGVKQSGTGREGPAWAVEEMTEPRLLVLR